MLKKALKYIVKKIGFRLKSITSSEKLIRTKIGNFNMYINQTHSLPNYLNQLPYYSSNVPRLASKIKEKYSDLMALDVGANIGDTVALIRSKTPIPIVCIEGDDFYYAILKKNIEQFNEVHTFKLFLGEKNKTFTAKKESNQGTLKIVPVEKDSPTNHLQIISLDHFLDQYPQFNSAKLLKIDTDGFDLMVLRGGTKYLAETRPILFFEYYRALFEELNEDGLATLNLLETIGYQTAIFYDNCGRLILSADLKNKPLIEQLHFYISTKENAIVYYDICIFHQIDNELAEEFIRTEMALFKKA